MRACARFRSLFCIVALLLKSDSMILFRRFLSRARKKPKLIQNIHPQKTLQRIKKCARLYQQRGKHSKTTHTQP
jgi:hypothetical protein